MSNESTSESLSIRSVNNQLTKMFQKYSMIIGKLTGNDLIGMSQIREMYDPQTENFTSYSKGRLVFKNGIDTMSYLLSHKNAVSKVIGVDVNTIGENKRNIGKMRGFLAKFKNAYEIGDVNYPMQMYISMVDDNTTDLSFSNYWTDYILTQKWIDDLAYASASSDPSVLEVLSDYRISYLSNLVQGMLKDHEVDYHLGIEGFDESKFLNNVSGSEFDRAVDMVNALPKLNYMLYEIHKPIGKSKEKYFNVKLFVDGTVEASGVVGLKDCEEWDWEYGSKDYLRSLNTGNKRYLFRVDRPINDLSDDTPKGSTVWWKPDEPEQIEYDTPPEVDESGFEIKRPTVNYYKKYETERMLRWFGSTRFPKFDVDSIDKASICSSPELSDDAQSDDFNEDSNNIASGGIDLAKANVDESTSLSLLSLAPKAYLKVEDNPGGREGQYLVIVVSGNQQTSNVSFLVRGSTSLDIEEMNHYIHTWNMTTEIYKAIASETLFLEMSVHLQPNIEYVWSKLNPDGKFILDEWKILRDSLAKMVQNPSQADLLRFRQIDFETILLEMNEQCKDRLDFLKEMNDEYITQRWTGDEVTRLELLDLVGRGNAFFCSDMYNYISQFGNGSAQLRDFYSGIPMSDYAKSTMIRKPLQRIYGKDVEEWPLDEQAEWKKREKRYAISFDGTTVDDLRERILTFNNLVVRLPTDTKHNKLASKHIFLDWKAFVDGAVEKLADEKLIFLGDLVDGLGTDIQLHKFREIYIDEAKTIPLVDYSYIYDPELGPMEPYIDEETGKPLHDRWDYWSADDFG